jgi:hypothetical protein
LPREVGDRLDRRDGFPKLASGLESSIPGLHFLGAPSAWTFGPLMYFVAGTQYAARALTRAIAHNGRRSV